MQRDKARIRWITGTRKKRQAERIKRRETGMKAQKRYKKEKARDRR